MRIENTPRLSILVGTALMITGSAMAETPTLPGAAATLSPEELRPLLEAYDGALAFDKFRDEAGMTVGHHAARNLEHPDVALLLIEFGVKFAAIDNDGYTPLGTGVLNDYVYFVWNVTQKARGWFSIESAKNSGKSMCERRVVSNPSCSFMLQRHSK
ncbi:MAG: hypothetical protein AAGE38_17090 [Pseudomonadota bacterium]